MQLELLRARRRREDESRLALSLTRRLPRGRSAVADTHHVVAEQCLFVLPFGPQLAQRVSCIEHTRWLVLCVDNRYVDEAALTNFWFIPETFSVEHRIGIEPRRTAKFLRTVNSNKGAHQLMLLIVGI